MIFNISRLLFTFSLYSKIKVRCAESKEFSMILILRPRTYDL
jgi:hypothetical protein